MQNAHPDTPFILVEHDHKILVKRWDALVTALEHAADRGVVRDCIQGLISCAQEHFRNEEWAMREISFPDYVSHKADHRRLLNEADDMLRNFDGVFSKKDWSALAIYFRHWIATHNKKHDKALHNYARQVGASP